MIKACLLKIGVVKIICLLAGCLFSGALLYGYSYAETIVSSGEEASISSPAQPDNKAIKDKIEELNNAEMNGVKLFFHPPLPLLKSE